MRMYFEMQEELSEEELLTQQPQMIRVEITDESESDSLLQQFEPYFEGKKYWARIHYCYHEERKPCKVKMLRE